MNPQTPISCFVDRKCGDWGGLYTVVGGNAKQTNLSSKNEMKSPRTNCTFGFLPTQKA